MSRSSMAAAAFSASGVAVSCAGVLCTASAWRSQLGVPGSAPSAAESRLGGGTAIAAAAGAGGGVAIPTGGAAAAAGGWRCAVAAERPAGGGAPWRSARASGSFRCAIWREASLMPREEASALSSASYSAAARAPSPSLRCMFATDKQLEAVGRSRCAASNHAAAPAKSRCWLAATPRACCSSASAASASLTSSPLPSPSSSSAATPLASAISASSSSASVTIPSSPS